jgi:hypothetical protein
MRKPNGLFVSQVSKAETPGLLCIHCFLDNLLLVRENFHRKLEMTSKIPLCGFTEWIFSKTKKTFGSEIGNGQPINC